jgi:hypothetical protein
MIREENSQQIQIGIISKPSISNVLVKIAIVDKRGAVNPGVRGSYPTGGEKGLKKATYCL